MVRELFQPAVANRVPLSEGTGVAAAPEPKAPAGSAGHTNMITWWRAARWCIHEGRPSGRLWYRMLHGAFM